MLILFNYQPVVNDKSIQLISSVSRYSLFQQLTGGHPLGAIGGGLIGSQLFNRGGRWGGGWDDGWGGGWGGRGWGGRGWGGRGWGGRGGRWGGRGGWRGRGRGGWGRGGRRGRGDW